MPRKKQPKKDFGQGTCGYRFCNLPDKIFTKKKEDQKYCCDPHRVAEWNCQHPRVAADAAKQVPMDFMPGEINIINTTEPQRDIIVQPVFQRNNEVEEKLRDQGIEQVESHSKNFVATMRAIAESISKEKGKVSSDDLRIEAEKLNIVPFHRNAWGSIFHAKGWMIIGNKKSEFKGNHARRINEWKFQEG